MNTSLTAALVDESASLSLAELARACRAAEEELRVWVVEGVIEPIVVAPTGAAAPQEWRFEGVALRRARRAARLVRDLELNVAGLALAMDLIDQVEALKAELRRRG